MVLLKDASSLRGLKRRSTRKSSLPKAGNIVPEEVDVGNTHENEERSTDALLSPQKVMLLPDDPVGLLNGGLDVVGKCELFEVLRSLDNIETWDWYIDSGVAGWDIEVTGGVTTNGSGWLKRLLVVEWKDETGKGLIGDFTLVRICRISYCPTVAPRFRPLFPEFESGDIGEIRLL